MSHSDLFQDSISSSQLPLQFPSKFGKQRAEVPAVNESGKDLSCVRGAPVPSWPDFHPERAENRVWCQTSTL